MKKRILNLLAAITLVFSVGALLVAMPSASAQAPTPTPAPQAPQQNTPRNAACEGLALTGAPADCAEDPDQPTVSNTLALAINIFSVIIGVAGVIMIMVGGFKYIISSGNDQNVNSAKNTIMFAIIGLVIVAMAQVIVRFVIDEATEVTPPTTTTAPAPGP